MSALSNTFLSDLLLGDDKRSHNTNLFQQSDQVVEEFFFDDLPVLPVRDGAELDMKLLVGRRDQFGNQPPTFSEYLKAFQSDFWARMSGGASVPFTAAAIYFFGYTRLLFALLAIFCVIFSPFRLWQAAQIEIRNLKKRPYDDA